MLDGLLDECLAARRPHRLCAVGELEAKLDPQDRAALDAVLTNHSIRATDIKSVLSQRGVHVPAESIRRHRRRAEGNGCGCP